MGFASHASEQIEQGDAITQAGMRAKTIFIMITAVTNLISSMPGLVATKAQIFLAQSFVTCI